MKFTDQIKNYMNGNIVYINEDEHLADAIFKMSNAETDIAVVKSKDDIVGVITESDIYYSLVKGIFSDISREIDDIHVADIMRGPNIKKVMTPCNPTGWHACINVYEYDTLENAVRIMQEGSLHHLLVFNKNNNLVGSLSSHDIIKNYGKR